jgi:opacity protein-like surface antigen
MPDRSCIAGRDEPGLRPARLQSLVTYAGKNSMKRMLFAAAFALAAGGSALAADFPMPGPPPAYIPTLPVYNWTGFYIGANGGGAFGNSNWTDPTQAATGNFTEDDDASQRKPRSSRNSAVLQVAGWIQVEHPRQVDFTVPNKLLATADQVTKLHVIASGLND